MFSAEELQRYLAALQSFITLFYAHKSKECKIQENSHKSSEHSNNAKLKRKMPRTIKMIAGRKLDKNLGNCYFGGKRCGSCLREELRAGRQSVFSATGGKFPIFSKEYLTELYFLFSSASTVKQPTFSLRPIISSILKVLKSFQLGMLYCEL